MGRYIMISIIIPSYKDPLLKKTIESIIMAAEGPIEVIAVLDGYWPLAEHIVEDKRVKYLHLGKNGGMREAINAGVAISKGEYIMRFDEHCVVGKGFDTILLKDTKDNWIVTPRRYFLDTEKWKVMDLPPVDYERLGVQTIGNGRKFCGMPWDRPDREDIPIDESMGMQGSCWFMKKSWWDKVIKRLDSKKYGPLLQDSHEMIFKTWKAGGKMMVNKNTFFAHKHVSFPRTHQHSTADAERETRAFYEEWQDYYRNEIKPKWKKLVS